jgi:hypothetical protein
VRIIFAFCFLLIAAWCLAADKQATADYKSLVERARTGDQTVDFRRLRLAYADSADYENAPDTDSQKKAMWVALNGKSYQEAIKNAETVLNANYADIDAQYVEYAAYHQLKNSDLSDVHGFIFHGLLKSITGSGNGKSPETAMQVIDVHEEYVVLRSMGVGLPKQQSLARTNGHAYDKITFDNPDDGKEMVLFFDVDITMKHGL